MRTIFVAFVFRNQSEDRLDLILRPISIFQHIQCEIILLKIEYTNQLPMMMGKMLMECP